MSPQQFRIVSQVFQRAVELSPGERAGYLDDVCAGNEGLRREVEELLRSDSEAVGKLDCAVLEAAWKYQQDPPRTRSTNLAGSRVGPYEIVREIGHGGMGAVYEAVRERDSRSVALKVIHGMERPDALARFRVEREVLASLHHPNIAALLDGGTAEDGRPYLVMEYIEGQPLLEYCRERELSIAERLDLFCQLCSAVHHAHQMLVLHRDIKPANVLVTADGVPKLLDFGIAKLIGKERDQDTASATITALRRLTPQYASPEQIRGEPLTTASDVYSLGVLLFELLTFRSPYHTAGHSVGEVERAVCEQEPTRLSRAVPGNPRLRRELAGDLDNIVAMALRKEARRRYSSAQGLADDLIRHLNGQPVSAREDTIFYIAGKLVRRNKLASAAFLLLAISVAIGWSMTIREARRTEARFHEVRRLANVLLRDIPRDVQPLPGSVPVRAKLVRTALDYLNNLSRDASGDIGLQFDLAQAYDRVGDTQGDPDGPNLGQYQAALSSYRKALDLTDRVAKERQTIEILNALAWLHLKTGALLWRTGKSDEAFANFNSALQVAGRMKGDSRAYNVEREGYQRIARSWLAQRRLGDALNAANRALASAGKHAEAEPGYRSSQGIAVAQMVYGDIMGVTGRLAQSRRAYEEAVARLETVVAERPNFWPALEDLSDAYRRLGDLLAAPIYFHFGENEAAESYLARALAIDQRAAEHDPESLQARARLSLAWRRLGSVQREMKPKEAIQSYRRAIEIGDELLRTSPDDLNYQREVSNHHQVMAVALGRTGSAQAALRELETAMSVQRRLVQQLPNRTIVHEDWFHSLLALGDLQLRTGDRHKATEQYRQALEVARALVAKDAQNLYAQRCVAIALRALGDGCATLNRRDLAREYYSQALDLWSRWNRESIAVPYSAHREAEVRRALAAVSR